MPRLTRASSKNTIRVLLKLGFKEARQRGSHIILKKETAEGKVGCVVPMHGELAMGTLRGILRQAGISVEEFIKHL